MIFAERERVIFGLMEKVVEEPQFKGVLAPRFGSVVGNKTGVPQVKDVRRKEGGGWDDWKIPEDVTKYLTHIFGEGISIKPAGEKPSSVVMGSLGYTVRRGEEIVGRLQLETNSAGAATMNSHGEVEQTTDDWFLYTKK